MTTSPSAPEPNLLTVPEPVLVIVVVPPVVLTDIPVPPVITCAAVVSPFIEVIPADPPVWATKGLAGVPAPVIVVPSTEILTIGVAGFVLSVLSPVTEVTPADPPVCATKGLPDEPSPVIVVPSTLTVVAPVVFILVTKLDTKVVFEFRFVIKLLLFAISVVKVLFPTRFVINEVLLARFAVSTPVSYTHLTLPTNREV